MSERMHEVPGAMLSAVSGGAGQFDPAKSDGCSLAPDGWWRQACVDHDAKYFNGGTADQRRAADQALRDDMKKAGAPPGVPELYYGAVRMFGNTPGTPFRWGYGQKQ